MKTAEDFEKATGFKPVKDDLDRSNCPQAGEFGHWLCGWCKHDQPTQFCRECTSNIALAGGRGPT